MYNFRNESHGGMLSGTKEDSIVWRTNGIQQHTCFRINCNPFANTVDIVVSSWKTRPRSTSR